MTRFTKFRTSPEGPFPCRRG
jgi:hypothetical protein